LVFSKIINTHHLTIYCNYVKISFTPCNFRKRLERTPENRIPKLPYQYKPKDGICQGADGRNSSDPCDRNRPAA